MTKPRTKPRKERDIDKDTVVAYHDFIQGRIQGALNGVGIGPGHFLSQLALASFVFGFVCMIVGILVITLRHRHVYLVDWNSQFLGPFFLIMFLLCSAFGTFLLLMAKRRTNAYRGDLRFRPIGDYGVAVVHTSKLTYDDQKRSELKSGTTPHNVRHPGRPKQKVTKEKIRERMFQGVNEKGNRGDYSRSRGYDNRGYNREDRPDGGRDRHDYDRGRNEKDREYRDMVKDYREKGRRPEGDRRPPDDDRRRRPPGDDRRRPPDDERRRPPDDDRRRRPPPDDDRRRRPPPEGERRRPPDEGDRRRPPDEGDRRRPPDDREKGRQGGRGPPRDPEEAKRREERRRQYEEEKRRRYEEDRRRAELRKQAEAESSGQPVEGERGVDVDGNRTYQIQTTVKLSREMQEADESEL